MYFPVSDLSSSDRAEPAAEVVMAAWADAQWNRPFFKAPPLKVNVSMLDPRRLAEELRRLGPVSR